MDLKSGDGAAAMRYSTHTRPTVPTHRPFHRMQPFALTQRTSKRSGYSRGGSRSGSGRGEGA